MTEGVNALAPRFRQWQGADLEQRDAEEALGQVHEAHFSCTDSETQSVEVINFG